MEDLPEALVVEIVNRITRISDLNSLSLVSKRFYTIEADQRCAIHVGCGLFPATEALTLLCSRFPKLCKVEIDYSGWQPGDRDRLNNQGFLVISSCCPSLTDLTLSFCSNINDSGLVYLAYCKKLVSLRLNSVPEITSSGLLSVAISCKSLSGLYLINCKKIGSQEWLEYLGWNRSLKELTVKNCKEINQYDLLKFGPGWIKLQKFDFEMSGGVLDSITVRDYYDPLYNAHDPSRYDFCCESLKDFRLARMSTGTELEAGLHFLLGKCKSLEKLCLEYVHGLNDNDMIVLSQSCHNLKSISLWLAPVHYHDDFRTAFTDNSLQALAHSCPMLEVVELTFANCDAGWPTEIGFTQDGFLVLIQSCPIRVLVLNWANFFDDDGMKALSSAPLLETLELMDCEAITDVGIRSIACSPCLSNLTLRRCQRVTDGGVAELVHAKKLESLVIESCCLVSPQAAQGAARSVHYSESVPPGLIERTYF